MLAAPPAARAADAHDDSLPVAANFGFEVLKLSGGERLGLLGGSLLFGSDGWWVGPAIYGAASGERGGLFLLGAEVQRRWRLGPGHLVAAFSASAGGGAAAPVGGGLMLRPSLAWLWDLGSLHAGLSASAVRFSGGAISSRQIGLVLSFDERFHFAPAARAGASGSSVVRSGLGVEQLAATVTSYAPRGAGVSERRIALVGARADRPFGSTGGGGQWRWGLESSGAAAGDAAGYMEILGSLGWSIAPTRGGALRTGARATLGLGGGGGVPTGGGAIARLALTASLRISPTLGTGLELGQLRAFDSALRASVAQWWLSMALEPAAEGGAAGHGTLERTEWIPALQHYRRAARSAGGEGPIDTMGLKLARYAGEHVYGTMQAHSAYAGGAGAFSVGLIGAGWASRARPGTVRAGAELLLGAAGGGGVDSGGGAIVQALAWVAWPLHSDLELRAGAGALRSRRPGLSTPIVELSISRSFAQLAP